MGPEIPTKCELRYVSSNGEWVCDAHPNAEWAAYAICQVGLLLLQERAAEVEALRGESDRQYLAGIEWAIRHLSQREDWPVSWDAGFSGFKGLALIDRPSLLREMELRDALAKVRGNDDLHLFVSTPPGAG